MVDLSTTYLGLSLKNPLVASASPLSNRVETTRQLEEAGIAPIVMYSLFEEQILQDSLRLHRDVTQGTESFAEAMTYLPDLGAYANLRQYKIGPEVYLENLYNLKSAVQIPVIGSLNGLTNGGWIDYASKIEQAGADALELNIYNLPTNPEMTSGQLEDNYIDLVKSIRAAVKIPIAVKLSPFFTALPNFVFKGDMMCGEFVNLEIIFEVRLREARPPDHFKHSTLGNRAGKSGCGSITPSRIEQVVRCTRFQASEST